MSAYLSSVRTGIRRSLRPARRKGLFAAVTLLSFAALFSVPVWTIPGNTFAFQLSLTRWTNMAFLLILSSLVGLTVVLRLERRSCRACRPSLSGAIGQGGAGTLAAVGGLFAAPLCPVCVSGVLGAFGVSAAASILLVEYHWYVVGAALAVAALSVTFMARQVGRATIEGPGCPSGQRAPSRA